VSYAVQEHVKPRALVGISDVQITQHWTVYRGYVANVNALLEDVDKTEVGSRPWAEVRRRLGFEFNGMVLHEYYFGNLKAATTPSPRSRLAGALDETWRSRDAWRDDFAATAAMRGSGWAILYRDAHANRLFNWWVGDHEVSQPVGLHPLLVLDVWEHAWMVDYGAGQRGVYIDAFLQNVDWPVVEQRFDESLDGKTPSRS
jgi:Fe-Mn family superoxide dismutase